MMANVDVWVSNQITLRFNWSQSSQSIANNNSVVSWNLQLIASGGSISSSASKAWNVTVNGTNYSGTNTVGISNGTTKTLASGSTTIGHNADGTKSFSFSFSQQFDINYSGVGWISTKSGSGSGTLTTIPRTSSVSSTNANIGENITITINRASSSFTHTLTYAFNSLTGTIATKTSSTSISWTLPTSFYAQMPNSRSSWGRVICDTYSGSTKIGSSECRFDVYIKESSNKPGISASVVDINATTKALTGDENKLIKYYSNVRFNIDSTPKNSASTEGIYINYLGNSFTGGSGNHWSAEFSNVISGQYICSVTDTRGLSNSVTINKTLINYIKLSCAMTVSNPTASGECTLTIKGNYFNGSFGATSNTLTVQYKKNSGSWTNATATKSGNTYTATVKLTGLDYTQAYTFQARAVDKLATVTTESKTVKSTPIFDWGSDDFHFHVPVTINGNSKAIEIGTGESDVYVHNTKSGKYLQLKDDGTLSYDNKVIYLPQDDLQKTIDKFDLINLSNETYVITEPLIIRREKSIKGNHAKIVADFENWKGNDYTAIKIIIDETPQHPDEIFDALNRIISDVEIVGINNKNIQTNGVVIQSSLPIEETVTMNYAFNGEFHHVTIRNFDTGLVLNECWASNFNSCKIFNVRQGIKIKGKSVNNNFNGCQVTNPSKEYTSSSDKSIGISVSNGTHYTKGEGRPEGLTFNQCLVFGYDYNAKIEHCYFTTFNSCILDGAMYNNVLLRSTQNIFFNQCYLCQTFGEEPNISYYYDDSLGSYVNRVNIVNCDLQGINNPNAIEFKTDCPTELVVFNIEGNSFNGFNHCIRANCVAPSASSVVGNVVYNVTGSFINVIAGFGRTKIDNNNIYSSVDIIKLPMPFASDMIIGKNFSKSAHTYYQGVATLRRGETEVDLPNNIFNSEKGLFCQTIVTPATPIGQYWVADNILWSKAKLTVANAPDQDTTIYYTVRVFTRKATIS